jgi:RND family efflux transporter MFP subunit
MKLNGDQPENRSFAMNAQHRDSTAVLEPNDFPDPMDSKGVTHGPPPKLGKMAMIALVIAGAAFVVGFVPRMKEHAQVKHDGQELAVPTVAVISPLPAKPSTPLALSGELKAVSETALVARVGGYVKSWTADIGAKVEAGQVLAELDTPETAQDLAKAKAELTQMQAAEKLSELTAKRWQEMRAAKTVSAQEADEKVADLSLKQATVSAAEATVQRLEEWMGYNKITAPFAGTVTARHLDVGQLVNTDVKEELYRLAQTDHLRVFIRVPQNYARAAVVGLTVDLTVPDLPGRTFPAKIVRTAGSFDAQSRTLLVELEVDNTKNELFAGSYGLVRLTGAQPDAVLSVPANALLFRSEGTLVALVGADNHVSLRKVELGRDFGSTVEILSGVTANDRLVVNPADSLVEGSEVRVAAAEPAKAK